MPEEWLTVPQTAELLSCPPELVRAMLRGGFLPGKKVDDPWLVQAAKVEELRTEMNQAPIAPTRVTQPEVDIGMVEVTLALAGVGTAIAAILPGIGDIPKTLSLVVATVAAASSAVAFFSAYSALWLLARYCCTGESQTGTDESGLKFLGIGEVMALLKSWTELGPYTFVVIGLLFLLVLSFAVGILAVAR
jgi:hypothetical protein